MIPAILPIQKGYTRNDTTSFSRKRVIVKSDNICGAMLNGLLNARGKYITILTGDIVSNPVDL